MEQYIKKSALVAEIEARYNECLKRAKITDAEYWNGKADAYRDMLVVLDTFEVKEVDLCKEKERIWKNFNMAECRLSKNDLEKISKHFLNLV